MALLQYDIRVVGKETVDRALAGIEARIRQHNTAVSRATGKTAGIKALGGANASANTASREKAQAAREEVRIKNAVNAVNLRAIRNEEQAKVRSLREEQHRHFGA